MNSISVTVNGCKIEWCLSPMLFRDIRFGDFHLTSNNSIVFNWSYFGNYKSRSNYQGGL